MDPQPPSPASDYWYLGSSDPDIDHLFRRVCALAWPYASYCANRYLHDPHAAYDLMDSAVENVESYFERSQRKRNSAQLLYRMLSVIRRHSKSRAQRRREIGYGSLSELEQMAHMHSSKSEAEQMAFVHDVLDKMSPLSREIAYLRLAGHSWRQVANELGADHVTLFRVFHKEVHGLLLSTSEKTKHRGNGD
jgi:hypothetical protein